MCIVYGIKPSYMLSLYTLNQNVNKSTDNYLNYEWVFVDKIYNHNHIFSKNVYSSLVVLELVLKVKLINSLVKNIITLGLPYIRYPLCKNTDEDWPVA